MKKTLLFLAIVLSAHITLNAQEAGSGKAAGIYFDTYIGEMTELMGDADYKGALELGRRCAVWMTALSSHERETVPYPWYYHILMSESAARNGQTDEAVRYLRAAIEDGCNHLRDIIDLEALPILTSYGPYNTIVEPMREEADFKGLLRRDHDYRTREGYLPAFTYAPAGDEGLTSVRRELDLLAVAGSGDELSRIVNILDWVHNTVPHNGARNYRGEPNALAIYQYNKETGNGVNCRMLATMLKDCYLSLGIPARVVTCLPESEEDMDCHVINAVWSETLGKWLWVDPSYAAYITDGEGNMLGIGEVRQRLIDGLPVHVREGANWNHRGPVTDEFYLHQYMAKNLYWIECSVDNGFNSENQYVQLVPHGTEVWNHRPEALRTSDPDYFWQAPVTNAGAAR
ncbi:MAG: transglutaminase-like domain-containing protein [Alistipes sp.]|nr:transglutaminase-like domain-containing protein [Alistipes sp.]